MRPVDRPDVPRFAGFLYRIALRLYPAPFRACYEDPMRETFATVCRDARARGRAALVREVMAECVNAAAAAWRMRYGPRQQQPGGDGFLRVLLLDLRHAARRLRTAPAVLLLTILTLGFAIAAATAVFSIVDAVLLRPSPFADASRLMGLMNVSATGGYRYPGMSREKLRHWRSETAIFEAVEAFRPTSVIVTGGDEPREVPAAHVTPGLVATLGVAPRLGRLFSPDDAQTGSHAVVLISEAFWRARLGADADVVGRTIDVNGRPHVVRGVMPRGFHFPTVRQALWLPLDAEARPGPGEAASQMVVRLVEGLTIDEARERLAISAARLQLERPLPTGWEVALVPGTAFGPDERTRRTVLILFGAVALVVLTACANVAHLLLSRAVERRREFAIRLVLGAGRWRLGRELVLEGLLTGAAAAAIGLVVATWALDLLVRLAPESLLYATATSIAIDPRAFTFGLVLALGTGVICNLPPVIGSARAVGMATLMGRTRTAAVTPAHRRLTATLVVAEIALAVVLLVGAALMVRSFVRLNAIDIGFDPEQLLAVTIGLDGRQYGDERARAAFLRGLAADLDAAPGVSGVAYASGLPPSPGTLGLAELSTDSGRCSTERLPVVSNLVSPSYFDLMGIPVAEGRPLRLDDPPEAVVVSAALARLCGGSLAGRRLRLDRAAPPVQVVGVAGDVKSLGLTSDAGELAIYMRFDADPSVLPMVATMNPRQVVPRRLIIRTATPNDLIPLVKRTIWARDPHQPVLHAGPASELMAGSIRRERFVLALMSLFSAVTLVLASAGIFGALAYTVAQQRNEIGIRMALGASARDVRRLVVGQGLALAVTGSALGLAGAFAFSRVLAGLLYGVEPRDPAAFALTAVVVLLVAVLAAWVPTARALRVDPASALRVE